MNTVRADASATRHLEQRWRLRVLASVACLLATAVLLAACAPRRASNAPPLPVARIGAALSLSGSAKPFGSAQRSGIRLAQDEINASHVLGNTRLDVMIEDDGSDRERASAVFQS